MVQSVMRQQCISNSTERIFKFVDSILSLRQFTAESKTIRQKEDTLLFFIETTDPAQGSIVCVVLVPVDDSIESGSTIGVASTLDLSSRTTKAIKSGIIGSEVAKEIMTHFRSNIPGTLVVVCDTITTQAHNIFRHRFRRYTYFSCADALITDSNPNGGIRATVRRSTVAPTVLVPYSTSDPLAKHHGCTHGDTFVLTEWESDFGPVQTTYRVVDKSA
jgi:hypothetical protein